ncbi:MAG: CDP-alcohol phosphatidyltransferase family protein [Rhodospirillales bacterium]|jgi:phosphatidylglycerophosphate synthase
MAMKSPPWDQRVARILVKPLVKSPVTPNQLTALTLITAITGAGLVATGEQAATNWGVGLFVWARFLDHCDGELARQKGTTSKLGYYLDYIVGALSYGTLFACIGIGLRSTEMKGWHLGDLPLLLGFAGMLSAIASMFVNIGIDQYQGRDESGDAIGYPGIAGFELEDGIYLIAPITWFGFLAPFFVLTSIGAAVYLLWSLWCFFRLRRTLATH